MVKKDITLSIAIAVFNEERNLRSCLDSVYSWTDEIVLVDGGSTDQTVKIAKEFNARIIHTHNPPIFHINKQKALEACRGMWILQLDADEVVTDELKDEIDSIIHASNSTIDGYFIPRKNFFSGHWLRKGGQYPDYVIRLVKKRKAVFPQKSVHEQITVSGEVGYLQHPLIHYSYRSIGEYWKKSDAYTSLSAWQMKNDNIPVNVVSYVQYNFFKPAKTFLSLYLRHKGFLDGAYGFLFALFSAFHYPIAYKKYLFMEKS